MDASSISPFVYDLRALEDAIQPYLKGKTDAEITQKIVIKLIESNEQLDIQFQSLRARMCGVVSLPVVSKLEQVVCDILGIKNSKTPERLFYDALVKENFVLAENILEQLPVEEKAAFVAKQLTAKDNYGMTPFESAIESRKLDKAKWLLKVSKDKKDAYGTDLALKQLKAVDKDGNSTLVQAMKSEDLNMVKWLLEQFEDDAIDFVIKQLTVKDRYGTGILQHAVHSNNIDMVKWLLEVSKGEMDADGIDLVVKQLTAENLGGLLPFTLAVRYKNLDIAKCFLEVSEGKMDADGIDLVVKQLTVKDFIGWTSFAYAVENKDIDMAKWLLEQLEGKKDDDGTDLFVKQLTDMNMKGKTPFAYAVEFGYVDMAKCILEASKGKKDARGTDLVLKQLTAVKKRRSIPFLVAVMNGDLDMAKCILEASKGKKGADGSDFIAKQLTAVDKDGKTPFVVAVASEKLDMAKWLLEQKDADGSDLVLKQLTAVYGLTNLKCLIDASELFPVVLDAFHASVDKLPDALSAPFKKAFELKERPSALEFYCTLALVEEPSKLISNQIKAWNVLRDGALKLPNKELCIRASSALKKLMADPSRLNRRLAEVLNDSDKPIAWRLMYLEIALDDNQANAQLFTSMLDKCTVNFKDDSIQKCLLILSLMESVSIAEKKGGKDSLVRILHFLFDMNESRAFFKEVRNFRSALIILSDAELNSHLDKLDQRICNIKETSGKKINEIKNQIASKQAAPTNRANEMEIKELSKKLQPLYQKFTRDSCRTWFKEIVRAKADVECDVDKMLENLEKALAGRYPDAHITYLSTLSSAPYTSEEVVKKSVSDFFKAMEQAHGPSPSWEKRYSPEHNPHIREVEKVHFGFYEKWQGLLDDTSLQERFKQIPAEITNADDAGQKKSTREVLENALRDGHLSGRDDFLQRLLSGDSEESLLGQLEGDLEKATTEQRDILLAQKELILLTKTPLKGSVEDLGARFEQIGKWLQLKEGDLFKADLDTLKALVMPQIAQKTSSDEIRLRGDFASILLGGTEIRGSCQHIEHSSEHSRGTVGYLLNGHLMLGSCDSMERWTMRTLLRPVLLKQKNGVREVVLLLEMIYPTTRSEKDSLVLITAAQEIATRLGVGLVSVVEGRGDVVEGDLLLTGGVAPEYVDAGGCVIYEADKAFKLLRSHWLHESTRLPASG